MLFHEYQVDSANDKQEGQNVVPVKVSTLEHDVGNDAEYCKRDALLNDLELDEVERASVLDESKSVGGYLAAVLEESYHPREGNDADEGPVVGYAVLLKFQMPIPSKRHEDVA